MREAFRCPNCDAEYVVERIEATPTHYKQLLCVECGGYAIAKASLR
jgi:hypothetical protein